MHGDTPFPGRTLRWAVSEAPVAVAAKSWGDFGRHISIAVATNPFRGLGNAAARPKEFRSELKGRRFFCELALFVTEPNISVYSALLSGGVCCQTSFVDPRRR